MKITSLFLLVCLLSPQAFAQQEVGSGERALVFTHVTVIDATGVPAQPDMTVVVRDGLIEALGQTGQLAVPRDAHVVDATGKFLIPGLWDMHVHLPDTDYLGVFIANGVTGVRVMGERPHYHEWCQEISAGELFGPLIVCGMSRPVSKLGWHLNHCAPLPMMRSTTD